MAETVDGLRRQLDAQAKEYKALLDAAHETIERQKQDIEEYKMENTRQLQEIIAISETGDSKASHRAKVFLGET